MKEDFTGWSGAFNQFLAEWPNLGAGAFATILCSVISISFIQGLRRHQLTEHIKLRQIAESGKMTVTYPARYSAWQLRGLSMGICAALIPIVLVFFDTPPKFMVAHSVLGAPFPPIIMFIVIMICEKWFPETANKLKHKDCRRDPNPEPPLMGERRKSLNTTGEFDGTRTGNWWGP